MAIDRTSIIEDRVSPKELKVGRREYRRFFQFVFSRVYVASSFLLCLGIGGELLLPLAAVLWKTFVDRVSAMSVGVGIGSGVVLSLAGYMLLSCVREAAGQMTRLVGEQAFVLDEVQKNRFAEHVLAKMHAKISRLPADYFESAAFYDRVERAFAFAGDRMRREVIGGFYAVASGAIGAVVCLAALAAYHPLLCAAAALAPLPTLYSRIVESRISLRLRRDTSEDRRRLEYYEELVRRSAAKELKVMDAGEFIMGKWEALAARYARAEIDTRLKSGCVRLVGVLVNALAASGSAALAVWLLTRGDLSLGAVAAVLPLTQALVKNVGAAMAGLGDVVANRREIAQLLEFLDLPEDPDETDADCPEFQSVEVKGLRFRYPFSDRFVLKGMDFSIRRGEIVALVGPNGSGKSTYREDTARYPDADGG